MWFVASMAIGFVVYLAAAGRGRTSPGWFVYCVLFWPIALIHVLAVPGEGEVAKRERDEIRIPCPFCAEAILPAARLCPHCRSELEAAKGADPSEAENDRQLRELIAAARRRENA